MRYAQIIPFEVCNGEGIGCSLFVQGCHFHCNGCFNQEAWDFNGGKEWNEDIKNKFFEIIKRPYIKRITILGGEPLSSENLDEILQLIKEINMYYPDKAIWLYTGYTWEKIKNKFDEYKYTTFSSGADEWLLRYEIVGNVDIVVDGQFEKDEKDLTLKFKGSKNQRIIDIQKSIKEDMVILHE